jgi:hypothetical protein
MSITTNAELLTAVAGWLDRTDLSSHLPEFVVIFEAALNRRLAVRQQMTSTTLTVTAGSATLPTDYLLWKRVTWQGNPTRQLEYVTPEFLAAFNASGNSGSPTYFTIENATLKVGLLDNTSLNLLYAQKVPPLATTDPNWLLTANPDAYLFGTLAAAKTFTSGDDGRGGALGEFKLTVEGIVDDLNKLNFAQMGTVRQHTMDATP